MNEALKALKPLTLKRTPELNLSVLHHFSWVSSNGLDFQIGISGDGFDAYRNCNRDELIAIRGWINEALAASETENT